MPNAKLRRAALAALISSGCYVGFDNVAVASSWVNGNATWSNNGDPGWGGSGVPNSQGALAERTGALGAITTQDIALGVTVGTIRQGGSTNVAWTITNTNGLTLDMDGAGAGTAVIENVNTVTTPNGVQGLVISAGSLTLADDLLIRNNSLSTRSGGAIAIASSISGAGHITIENNSTSGTINLTAGINHDGNIINAGNGTAGVVISGAIGAQVDNIVQSNATNVLTLSGANTSFVGTVSLTAGTLAFGNAAAMGSGKLVLAGGTLATSGGGIILTGSPTLELRGNSVFAGTNSMTFGNGAINVAADSSLATTLTGTFTTSGAVTGTGKLHFIRNGGAFAFSGPISNVGNLTIENNTTGSGNSFSGAINNTGTFTYAGTTAQTSTTTTFSGGVGANVTEIIQTHTGQFFDITVGGVTIGASGKILTSNTTATTGRNLRLRGGIVGSGALTLNMLSANAANEIVIDINPVNHVGTILAQGTGGGTSRISGGVGSNVFSITQNSATAPLIIDATAVQMNSGGTTLTSGALGSNTAIFSITGGTGGTGNLLIQNNSNMANGISFSSNTVNHDGLITNQGTGGSLATGNVIISSAIGTNVDGVVQDSATSGLTLNATNLFTGGVQVKKGTLSLQTAASAGNGGTLSIGESNTSYNATVLITANVAVANPVTIATNNSGVITLAGRGSSTTGASFSGPMALNDDIVANAQTTGRFNLSGTITGNKTITVDSDAAIENNGLAVVFFSGNNAAFSGGVIVKRGHASAQTNANGFGTAPITLGHATGGDVKLSVATLTVGNDINVAAGIGTRTIGGFSDGGTAATFTGTITLAKDLIIAPIATGTGHFTISGNIGGAGNLLIANTAGGTSNQTLSGGINMVGELLNNTTSTRVTTISGIIGPNVTGLTQNAVGGMILSGANTFTSGTTLAGGILQLDNTLALQNSTLNKTGGTLSFGALVTSATLGGLTGNSGIALINNSTVTPTGLSLSVGNNGSSNSYAGALSNIGSITKIGGGTQTLSGTNTYSGATTVSAGTLLVNGTHTGAGAYAVDNGGTLGGTGMISTADANVTVALGGKLSPGASPGNLTFNLGAGTLDLSAATAGTGALVYELGASSDQITVGTGGVNVGTLEFDDFVFSVTGPLAEGDYVLINGNSAITGSLGAITSGTFGGYDGVLSLGDGGNDVVLTVSAVPEPASLGLLGLASMGMLARRRRNRR